MRGVSGPRPRPGRAVARHRGHRPQRRLMDGGRGTCRRRPGATSASASTSTSRTSYEDRGVGEDEAEERAARTVNKERARQGETKAQRRSAHDQIGYALSSEEHAAGAPWSTTPVAEEAGFAFALISDHFHPVDRAAGHSPFVWTRPRGHRRGRRRRSSSGPGVTCPTIRIHPAIIAQAAATTAALMPGRFFLGVGTGENLNEHILGQALAGVGRPRGDARGGGRRSSASCGAARSPATAAALHGRERAHLHAARQAAADLCRGGRRADAPSWRAGSATGSSGPGPTARSSRPTSGAGAAGRGTARSRCVGRPRGGGAADGPRVVADGRALRRGRPRSCRTPPSSRSSPSIVTEDMVAEEIPCGPDPETHLAAIRRLSRRRLRPRLPPPGRSRSARLHRLRGARSSRLRSGSARPSRPSRAFARPPAQSRPSTATRRSATSWSSRTARSEALRARSTADGLDRHEHPPREGRAQRPPMITRDAHVGADEGGRGRRAEEHEGFRSYQGQLGLHPGQAGTHFRPVGSVMEASLARRRRSPLEVLDDVGDERSVRDRCRPDRARRRGCGPPDRRTARPPGPRGRRAAPRSA